MTECNTNLCANITFERKILLPSVSAVTTALWQLTYRRSTIYTSEITLYCTILPSRTLGHLQCWCLFLHICPPEIKYHPTQIPISVWTVRNPLACNQSSGGIGVFDYVMLHVSDKNKIGMAPICVRYHTTKPCKLINRLATYKELIVKKLKYVAPSN